jgi:hypothetical protein
MSIVAIFDSSFWMESSKPLSRMEYTKLDEFNQTLTSTFRILFDGRLIVSMNLEDWPVSMLRLDNSQGMPFAIQLVQLRLAHATVHVKSE